MVLGALLIAAAQASGVGAAPQRAAEIVVTGERVRRSLKDTASSVSVITRREIEGGPRATSRRCSRWCPTCSLAMAVRARPSAGRTPRARSTICQRFSASTGRGRRWCSMAAATPTTSSFSGRAGVGRRSDRSVPSPQTTTQGQNSIAGAIFVTTSDPTFTPEARTRAIAGNLGTGELSAMASAPLSGDVAMRVAGDLRYSRTASHIVDHIVGAEPNHEVFGLAAQSFW